MTHRAQSRNPKQLMFMDYLISKGITVRGDVTALRLDAKNNILSFYKIKIPSVSLSGLK